MPFLLIFSCVINTGVIGKMKTNVSKDYFVSAKVALISLKILKDRKIGRKCS